MESEIKQKFKEKINEKRLDLRCPICKSNGLIIEGPFGRPVQKDFKSVVLGGPTIPTMSVICSNCGHMREFALGALGLLEDINSKSKEEDDGK